MSEEPQDAAERESPIAKHLETVVWLVRHAETAAPTMFHGAESDIELGAHGHRQTAAAAGWFAALRPTVVVSSAMKRATETAAPIAVACGVPHLFEPQLHERRVGSLARAPRAEADHIWNDTVARWLTGETGYAHTGMESFDELRARVLPAFRRVVEAHPGGRVVIVCHGVVCKVLLLSLLRGYSHEHWDSIGRIPNLAVSELVPDGDFWTARQLLILPPPVVAANTQFADPALRRTEA